MISEGARVGLGQLGMFERRKAAQQACEVFLRENLGLLYRIASSYEAEPLSREDLLQEIVLAIWKAAGRYGSRSSFKTFALRIAHNRGITHSTREARSPELVDLSEEHASTCLDPESETEQAMRQEALLQAVRRLPVAHRQVVVMALEGMSYNEIAKVLDLSVSNVGVRLNRARARLREIMHV